MPTEDRIVVERERLPFNEVVGFPVRFIASNIRVKDQVSWNDVIPVSGIGQEGNLVLGQVSSIGARQEMEYLYDGEIVDVCLKPNDFIVGVLANRHSGTSEYGEVPPEGIEITEGTVIDLLAAGGVVGHCLGVPKTLGDSPTKITCVGLLAHPDGRKVDLRDFYPPWETRLTPSAPIILSCGTAAEIGKTTTASQLIIGLREHGVGKIAASKLAGTGRKRDIATLARAGAFPALDFPDVGLATTYTTPERYTPAIYTLLNRINREGGPQIIIGECGGDIIEGNIPTLLQNQAIMKYVCGIIHSSTDVLSIMGSLMLYEKWGILEKIPIYLTYPIKRNYQAVAQRLKEWNINLPIFDPLNQEENRKIVEEIASLSGIY